MLQQQCILHAINLFVIDAFYKQEYVPATIAQINLNELDSSTDESDIEFDISEAPHDLNSSIFNVIESIRCLMRYLKKSSTAKNAYRQYMDTSLQPEIDTPTRWNSMINMCRKFLQILPALKKAAVDNQEINEKINMFNNECLSKLKVK